MQYTQINDNDFYDLLVNQILSNEREHFHLNFELNKYQQLFNQLAENDIQKPFAQRQVDALAERLNRAELLNTTLRGQIADQAAFDAALARRIGASV